MGFPIDHPGILKMLADGSAVDTTPSQPGESPLPPPAFGGEAAFQEAVVGLARHMNWRVAHFRKVRVSRKSGSTYWETPVAADGRGFPDLLMLRGGRIVAAELKVGTNRETEEQAAWLAAFAAAGCESYLWRPERWAAIVACLARK
jgi:hypothetical protein